MELETYQAILVRSLNILSEEDQIKLDSLLDNDNTTREDTLDFLRSKIRTFDKLVAQESKKLKESLLINV